MPNEETSDQSDPNKGEDPKGGNLEKTFEDWEKRVNEKIVGAIDTGLSNLEESLTTKFSEKKPKKEEEEDDFSWEDPDGSEDPLTKKDLSKIISEVATKVKKETNKEFELKAKKSMRDNEAREDFPALDNKTQVFSKKFYDEVNREIEGRVRRGRSPEDIDLIYDSAAAVAARGQREGWYAPPEKIARMNSERNARGDNFSVYGKPRGKEGPSEGQMKYAETMGLSKESLSKHLERAKKFR